MLNILNLFSRNGELGLQLERSKGFKTTAYCEPDEGYRNVLKLVWPQAQEYASADAVLASPPAFDCLAATITDTHLGFVENSRYQEYFKLIQDLKPRWVISEHKTVLQNDGLEQLISMFTSLEYFADWYVPTDDYYKCMGTINTESLWIVAEPKSALASQFKSPILDLVQYRLMHTYMNVTLPDRRVPRVQIIHPPIPQCIGEAIVYRETNT